MSLVVGLKFRDGQIDYLSRGCGVVGLVLSLVGLFSHSHVFGDSALAI